VRLVIAGWVGAGLTATLLLASLAWGVFHPAQVPASTLVGRSAPELVIQPLNGSQVRLASLRGEPVVVNFWASWCVACRQEEAALSAAARSREGRVAFVGVDIQDSDPAARAFEAEVRRPYPVGPAISGSYLDFGVKAPPETFFIDARGTVVARFLGPLNSKTIDDYLRRIE
jgi:cytochrome c biogenesis protein CcmG/thiol:disulfide interchange protein DsbE